MRNGVKGGARRRAWEARPAKPSADQCAADFLFAAAAEAGEISMRIA